MKGAVNKKHNAIVPRNKENAVSPNYAAIDLGTNSCRLVIATPTPTSFHVVETFSKITRLGEGIINDNELSKAAMNFSSMGVPPCSEK